jgi:hypothetical protein
MMVNRIAVCALKLFVICIGDVGKEAAKVV